jgi:predicted MFS family arabinose efflux permease
MNDFVTENAIISGAIGFLAPTFLPMLFGLIEKVVKKALSAQAKKLIVLGVSLIIVLGISLTSFDWSGEQIEVATRFLQIYLVNNATFLGMVNNVYGMIIKFFPTLDQTLDSLENAIAGKTTEK